MKVEVNRNDESRRPSNRRAWKYWHPNAQWLYLASKHSGKPVDVPTLVSYTDSDKLYKFEGTVTLSND